MSHVPTVLKSDRSVFDKMLPVDDNDQLRLTEKTCNDGQGVSASKGLARGSLYVFLIFPLYYPSIPF